MKTFKKGEIPEVQLQKAIKKPIPIRCLQISEPFRVETMEGVLEGKAGDYLMIGPRGEMYPCDQEIFNETYDIVPDSH
jgi:hypothetical protein